ncbi:hypothetical protein [Cupriavidus sp. CuC1]|uniref:hypothetical protein n=1 Tax=Cupriavidus sp. CuC1 TaxID=3373131 RepID=UPI0037D82DDE
MHDDQRRHLAALVEQAREDLLRIGRALIDDESVKVSNLVGELNEIQEMVNDIGNPYLGFCSQSGRLGGVMFVMGEIGASIFELASNGGAESDRQLRLELQGYVREFGRTGKRLLRISETDVVFIVGDARVLHDHPDLAQADEVRRRLAAATDYLEEQSEVWWLMAEEAQKMAATYEAALAAHSFPQTIN